MPSEILVTASTSLLGLAIVAVAALRGWQGWLTLKLRDSPGKIAPTPAT